MITRISPEQAQIYVPCDEDFLSTPASFYTLTPDTTEDGWETVTYYTARKKEYSSLTNEGTFYIYVLSNMSMPGLLKIGYTRKLPEIRAQELFNATGVAHPFKVEWVFRCNDGDILEKEIHNALNHVRLTNNREFFNISLDEAIHTIKKIGERYIPK